LPAEADERAGAHQPRDLAVELVLPARPVELPFEQEARADAVGGALQAERLPLPLGALPARLADRRRVGRPLAGADGGEQRPGGDEVGITADRRGEMRVRGTAQSGVPEVRVAVVRLLQR